MMEKIRTLRKHHLKTVHNVTFYPYQEEISDAIIGALVQNLRLTSGATEEDVKKLKTIEVPVEISRQAGKTTAIVHTCDFIMVYFPTLFDLKRRLEMSIFAPQVEQAKTDFDRLKEALARSGVLVDTPDEVTPYKEENNSRTIVLPNGATCHIAPVSPTSLPESKSLALMIFEESQDLNDMIVSQKIFPMGATTNAPRVYIGTAGTRICYFRKLGQREGAIKIYFEDIVKQRRTVYDETGEVFHLIYEQYVRSEIEKHGLDSDEIQRPYFGKWLIGTGNFTTEEALMALVDAERGVTNRNLESEAYVGIDTAKHPDSTIVTILRPTGEIIERELENGSKVLYHKKEVINWLELRGENYGNQFEVIQNFLTNYRVIAVAIDSTGQGDFMPDMFEKNTEWSDENSGLYRMKFSLATKDIIYKNLRTQIDELLTRLPRLDTKKGEKFKQQMLDLQKEYKGNFLSVHHPEDASNVKADDLHDDYPDSWALAEWAFAKYNADNNVGIHVVASSKERNIRKNEKGQVEDYWPGDDD